MTIKDNVDLLVINGSWNSAIVLNPKWLQKYLFSGKEVNFKVNAHVPLGKMPIVSVEVEGLRIALQNDSLRIALQKDAFEEEKIQQVENIAFRLADTLLHTPVTSYGVNFGYRTFVSDHYHFNRDTALYTRIKDFSNGEFTRETTNFSLPYGEDGTELNIMVQEFPATEHPGTNVDVDINFHRPIEDLSMLKAGLDEIPMLECYKYAESIPNEIIESLSEEQHHE